MGEFIGPVIPEHLKIRSNQSEKDNEDESEVIGPALPPGWKKDVSSRDTNDYDQVIGPVLPSSNLIKKRSLDCDEDLKGNSRSSDKSKKSMKVETPKKIKKVIGPSLPPGLNVKSFERDKDGASYIGPSLPFESSSNQLTTCGDSSSDEDDEFTIGPLPPSGNFIEAEESRHAKSVQAPTGSKGLQREEWIASLPENSSVAHKLGFGKSMTSFSSKPVSIKDIAPVEHDNELDKAVDEYNKTTRPEALVDIHKKKIKEKKKEEAPARQLFDFNPDEDMKVRQLDSQQTKSIMEKAKLLNSRFSNPRGQNKFL